MNRFLLLSAGLILSASAVHATTFYVSPSGDDSNNNGKSSLTPFKSIGKGISAAGSADTVIVSGGTYQIFSQLMINKPLTLLGQGRPEVDGGGWVGGSSKRLLQITSSDVLVDGFVFKNLIGDFSIGVLINGSGRRITVQHCWITNIGWTSGPNSLSATPSGSNNANGILIDGTLASPLSQVNILYDTITNCALGFSEALTAIANIDTFKIAHNYVFANSNIGIDISGYNTSFPVVPPSAVNFPRNGNISDNIVYRCMSPIAFAGGIYLDGAYNCVVERNDVHDNGVGFSIGCEHVPGAGAMKCSRNIIANNFIHQNAFAGVIWGDSFKNSNTYVVNNTFVNNTLFKNRTGAVINGIMSVGGLSAGTTSNTDYGNIFGGELHIQNSDSSVFQNNIFFPWGGRRSVEVLNPYHATAASFRYNDFFKELPNNDIFEIVIGASLNSLTGPHYPNINSVGIDTNSIGNYPQFADTLNGNFRLMNTSPCVNNGNPGMTSATSGATDFYGQQRIIGGRIDIGAAESSVIPTTGIGTPMKGEFTVTLSPNPTVDMVSIETKEELVALSVFDMTGRLVYATENPLKPVQLGSQPAGVYVIRLQERGGMTATVRVVKL